MRQTHFPTPSGRPGFLFGDYSKGRQRYVGVLPCLRPLPRLSAAPSESLPLQRARHRAPFGNAPWPAGSSTNIGLELAEETVWSEPVSGSPIFPAGRESTGKLGISRQIRPAWTADPEGFRRLGPKFPNQLSRDFPIREQRTPWADQRAIFFDHGNGPFSGNFRRAGRPAGREKNPSPVLVNGRTPPRRLIRAGHVSKTYIVDIRRA